MLFLPMLSITATEEQTSISVDIDLVQKEQLHFLFEGLRGSFSKDTTVVGRGLE